MDQENRVVVLIDMDCFYCQVEEKLNPELKGKPIAVVQYNPWKGGGIIAVNYVARAMGVTRHMRGDEAKEKCPEINLPSVPCPKGKADITKYREAGKEVARVLQRFTSLLERASIDEAYLDITVPVQKRLQTLNINTITGCMIPNTYALGYDIVEEFISDVHSCGSDSVEFDYEHATQLLVGAVIVSEIRAAVYDETGYRCSAGIAHNKILAKLVCGMNKPNKQTVLPKHCINILYKTLPLKKVKHLGGKFGDLVIETLKIKTMGELQNFTEKDLQNRFDEKNGLWLYNIARGIDTEPVQARFNPKSIGCCKNFKGKAALMDFESVKKWLKDLGEEIEDRLEKDSLESNRTPKQMVVSFSVQISDSRDSSSSRSYNFLPDDELCGEMFSTKAFEILMESTEGCKLKEGESNRKLKAPIKFLGISVGKFEDNTESKKTKKIKDYFSANAAKENAQTSNESTKPIIAKKSNINEDKDYIMRNFFQPTEHKKQNLKEETVRSDDEVLESALDKQESFFAKFLNKNLNEDVKQASHEENEVKKVNRAISPVCDVERADDSNDTDYSGSTINEEINKSIALFEEDPTEISRVSNMRELLKTSNLVAERRSLENSEFDEPRVVTPEVTISNHVIPMVTAPEASTHSHIETIECSECGKTISLDKFDEHADYHLALTLRQEEREDARKAREKTIVKESNVKEVKKKKTAQEEVNKNEHVPSISKFFTKFDSTIPKKMCPECGVKVCTEKYAEHLDFHEAQKLSRELNKKQTFTALNNSSSSSVKRKKLSESPIKKSKVPCKPIDLFFR